MKNHNSGPSASAVAIIGMVGRFPGAADLDEYWRNLRDGVETITFFPEEKERGGITDPTFVRAKGVLENADLFDPVFFGFSHREAEIIDPQHRIFCECAWEALENAGYSSEQFEGAVGVFAGAGTNTYLLDVLSNAQLVKLVGGANILLMNDRSALANTVSYKLDLRGPSITLQAACATSLAAVHFACQSLLNGESDLALAGGVSITDQVGYRYQEGGLESPDGHCRAFDSEARGTVRGNGVGIVVLRRLADAIEDGDRIYAVINASAMNNDGADKVGYAAPGIKGQTAAMVEALALAGIPSHAVSYVEAHGTGTIMGDAVEVAALNRAFRTAAVRQGACAIGSVKSMIGHLDAAAGIAALIKTVLAINHRIIPPSLHFEKPNPEIRFEEGPFYVCTKPVPWEENGRPRCAAVNSYGFGGTNIFMVLEEAPPPRIFPSNRQFQLLLLSARTAEDLEAATARLTDYLEQHPSLDIADVCYTLAVGRKRFSFCRTVVAESSEEFVRLLSAPETAETQTRIWEVRNRPVIFRLHPATQVDINLGRDLYVSDACFRREIIKCCEILKSILELDLLDILYPKPENNLWAKTQIKNGLIGRLACFAVEYALARLWLEWGVRPKVVIGLGLGEFVGACLSGIFDLETTLCLLSLPEPLARNAIKERQPQAPEIPLFVSLSNGRVGAVEHTDWRYWIDRRHTAEICRIETDYDYEATDELLVEIGTGSEHGTDPKYLIAMLGRLWSAGVTIDWKSYYAHDNRRRLPLPTYPFRRGKYRIKRQRELFAGASPTDPPLNPDVHESLLYIPSWKRADVGAGPNLGKSPHSSRTWLIFVDEYQAASSLVDRLQEEREEFITVVPGSAFEMIGDRQYRIDPRKKSHYEMLLTASRTQGKLPNIIVHCWTVTLPNFSIVGPEAFEEMQYLGFYSLIFLAQGLSKETISEPIRLTVVTNHTQDVLGNENLIPEKATILGPCRVIPQEYNYLSCHCLDIDRLHLDSLFEYLTTETAARISAMRGNCRWVESFEPLVMKENTFGINRLRSKGVYLITGGLGKIGSALARYLAQTVQAKLILTGRSSLPTSAEQDRTGEGQEADELSRKIEAVREIERLGAEVLVVKADAADEREMKNALALAQRRFGDLNGVIHAAGFAGVRSFSSVKLLTEERSRKELRAKVQGAMVLKKVTSEVNLDFCLLVSSLSSVLGGLGYCAYSAANNFIDAMALRRYREGDRAWLSVNWEAWQFGKESLPKPELSFQAEQSLTLEEGIKVFERIFVLPHKPRLMVSCGELQARVEQWMRPREIPEALLPRSIGLSLPRRELRSEYQPPRDELEREIVEIWESLLGVEGIGIHDSFFGLGGHSLLALRFMRQLQNQRQVHLSLPIFLARPTVAEMAEWIRETEATRSEATGTPLVMIRAGTPGAAKKPFYCVHSDCGGILMYRDLAQHLDAARPFYGIESLYLDQTGQVYRRMEDIASLYAAAVCNFQPEGPYLLGGYSFGALVAFEMACRLKEQGKQVSFLGLIDAGANMANDRKEPIAMHDAELLTALTRELTLHLGKHRPEWPMSFREFCRLSPQERITCAFQQLKSTGVFVHDDDLPLFLRFIEGVAGRWEALRNYRPSFFPGEITLFRANNVNSIAADLLSNELPTDDYDAALGWGAFSSEPVRVIVIPGEHNFLIAEPYVRTLAERLGARLNEAD